MSFLAISVVACFVSQLYIIIFYISAVCFISVFGSLFLSFCLHVILLSSAACVEECLLFPPSSPSPGASKGGGPTQGVWRAHRHSPMGGELADAQTSQLYIGGRSILLICVCTFAIGLAFGHEPNIRSHSTWWFLFHTLHIKSQFIY